MRVYVVISNYHSMFPVIQGFASSIEDFVIILEEIEGDTICYTINIDTSSSAEEKIDEILEGNDGETIILPPTSV